jgi:CubicO group peptidase (beta-lactamase class C family)
MRSTGARQLLLCALSAALLSCATGLPGSPQKTSAAPADDFDQEVVRGPIGTRADAYLSRAAAFGFTGTVLLAVGETPVLHRGYGYADIATKKPNTTRTIYDIGSITKTLTGMGIMLLESRGQLTVEDRLGRFFPPLPQDKENIQLKHLLTHTSGIVDPPLGDYAPIGRDELVQVVFSAPLHAPIGTTYQYSNVGFSLLAAVIEKVSGRSYEEFMRDELFLPAGMRETGYVLPQWDASRIAHTYVLPVDHLSPLDRLRAARGPGWILMGNGGVLGTTGDLFRWDLALRKGSIIPAENVAAALQPHFQRNPGESIGYDWVISTSETGEVSYGHPSDAPYVGLCGWFGRYPAHQASMILLANNRLNGASTRHFVVPTLRKILAAEAVVAPPPIPTPAAMAGLLETLPGTYALDESNEITITGAEDHLELGALGQRGVDLINARQGPEAVATARKLNGRAGAFLAALQRQDGQAMAGYLGGGQADADSMLQEWQAALRTRGALEHGVALGTYRLDRRNAYVTTTRLIFDQGSLVVRFGWQNDRIVPTSEELLRPGLAGAVKLSPVPYAAWSPYWYADKGELFTFDLLTGTELRAMIVEAHGQPLALQFTTAAGESSRWMRR